MNLTEKQLSAILKRPGYAINEPTRRQRPAQLNTALPQGSKHEVKFVQIWGWLGGPELIREFRFCPQRKWMADFAHVQTQTLVEIEGFGHQLSRYQGDIEKYNKASELGFTLYRLTPNLITANKLTEIIEFIRSKKVTA